MGQGKFSAIEPEFGPERPAAGSDRSLGLVFAAACTLLAMWPLLRGQSPRVWLLLAACVFALAATCAPWALRPINIVWTRLGAFLHQVVTPILMGVVFFLVIAPIAWMSRAFGKDPLRLTWDADATSYWIARQPIGPDPQSMTRQF
jgi:saxitoxin biosynthesis operon SxtJ-like protein